MTKFLLSLFLLVSSATVFAQSLPSAVGRLFYTPEERARLDAEKRQSVVTGEAAPARRYQGFAQRRHGPLTVWIDGKFEENATRPAWPPGEYESPPDLLRGGRISARSPASVKP
jgi:hypothetical protein